MNYHEKRLEICKGCERFTKSSGQCLECLCFMRIKTRIKAVKCPLDKWGKLPSTKKEKNMIDWLESLNGRYTAEDQVKFWEYYKEYIDNTVTQTTCGSCFMNYVANFKRHVGK